MDDLEADYPLLGDLRETFLAAGGLQEDWDDLVHGLHHPQWALDWTDSSSPSHAKRLEDLGVSSLAAGNLIEYEVRETSNGSVTGLAIGLIKVYRHSRGHVSLEIKHLASTDDEFNDWAAYHINEDVSFHLHLCKKPPGSCTATPSSKKLGWLHVCRFRLTTFVSALGPDYSSDAILDGLRERVEALVGTFSPPGDSKVKLRPREDDHGGRAAEVEEERHKDPLKGRGGAPVGYKAAMGAATAKAGEVPKKRAFEPGPGGDRKRKDERGHDLDKSGEAMRAKNAAQQASRALMGGHPQMVLVEGREKKEKGLGYGGNQPWLDAISTGDEGGDFSKEPSGLPKTRTGGNGPPGGGGDDDDDDGDRRDDRGRKAEKRRRGSSDEEGRKKRKAEKKEYAPSRPVRASHIFPAGDKKKRRDGGSGGDPSSSPDGSGEGRRNKDPRKSGDKKKKKDKDRKRRRRRRSSETSSKSASGSDSQGEFYGKDSTKYESLAEKARKRPGMLLKSGLSQMAKFLTIRTGGTEEEASRSWRDQRVGAYLNQVLFTQHSQEKLGMRNVRELVTLAEAIDLLMEGQFAAVGDVLMQRMKAVESSVTDGWQLASHQELIPPAKATLSTNLERSFVVKQALQSKKLEESIRAKKG